MPNTFYFKAISGGGLKFKTTGAWHSQVGSPSTIDWDGADTVTFECRGFIYRMIVGTDTVYVDGSTWSSSAEALQNKLNDVSVFTNGEGTPLITVAATPPITGTGIIGDPLAFTQDSTHELVTATEKSTWNSILSTAESYADGLVVGLWDDRGSFDASGGAYPSSGGSGTAGAILKGDIWTISVAGTLPSAQIVEIGDIVRALTNTPGNTQANWAITQNNIGYTAENSANKDASGGYAGLTLFKINFKNVLNTITSFFTNSNTVARTYTFQNRDGTIADNTDITAAEARANHTGTQLAATVSDFNSAALSAAPAETTSTAGSLISGATDKATPVDADAIGLSDSAASNVLKKLTWANLKATLNSVYSQIIGRTTVADAAKVIITERWIALTSITTTRIWTLPAASSLSAGDSILIQDLSGSLTTSIKLTITRAGADTINGATTEDILSAYGTRRFYSDGVSAWTFDGGIVRLNGSQTLTNKTIVGSNNTLSAISLSSLASIAANSIPANTTGSSASPANTVTYKDVAEQTYVGTATWDGTPPSSTTTHTYRWCQIGGLVTLRINLKYATGGTTNLQVTLTLPADLPTPVGPTGFTAASDAQTPGSGNFGSSTSNVNQAGRVYIGLDGSSVPLITAIANAAFSAKTARLMIQYFGS